MMNRVLYLIVLLLAAMSCFVGCDNSINQPNKEGNGETVFLTVNTRSLPVNNGLSAEDHSINADKELAEDRVHSLAMLIFDSNDGKKIGTYIRDNLGSGEATRAFIIEVLPGEYDFYFVANMPDMETALGADAISNRQAMDSYLNESARALSETLYQGASQVEGFPMARVYLKQQVTSGGTFYQPKPFNPKLDNGELGKVVVNVSGNGDVEKPYVELIRVVAKLEVELTGSALSDVEGVSFGNANRHFSLVEFNTSPTAYFKGNPQLKKSGKSGTYLYYMPETIVSSSSGWSDTKTGDNKPINYFTINISDGRKFHVPIISNEKSIHSDYLTKAKGTFDGFTPDYTIYRNHHYKYKVNITEQDHPIEIIYEVDPWTVVEKSLYMGYGYNVEVEGKSVTITNTVDACPPYHIKLKTVDPFRIKGANEDVWVQEKEFADPTPGNSISFELNQEPVAGKGAYLNVYFNDHPVKTFSK